MHSWTFRLNAIFTFTVTVLAVLSALNALSVAFLNPAPIATIDNVTLQRLPGSGWVPNQTLFILEPQLPPLIRLMPQLQLFSASVERLATSLAYLVGW